MRRILPLLASFAALAATPALAWETIGHRLVTKVAVKALPPELPRFLRTPEALTAMTELSVEPDRSKGAGQPHDADLDAGHFIDVDDQGKIEGGPPLVALPGNRQAYEAALQAVGKSSWRSGWLPYNIVDGYEQLAKDFAYWRAARVGERTAETPARRAWFALDRKRREAIIVHDLGYWSHFVGDGSQPLHVTVHYNGWGDYPNPKNYTKEHIHGPFEGDFVTANVTEAAVAAALAPYRHCACTPFMATERYLQATAAKVEPLYRLWTDGGFRDGDPRGAAFTVEAVAAGAAELRDMVVDAWRDSDRYTVGYPNPTPARAVEASGKASYESIHGPDARTSP
jgi:hypothetical protein